MVTEAWARAEAVELGVNLGEKATAAAATAVADSAAVDSAAVDSADSADSVETVVPHTQHMSIAR